MLDDPPSDADTQFPEAWSTDYDGVGVVYLPSAADMEGLITHPEFPVLLADEWGAFNEPVANFSLLTTEELLKDRRGTSIKLFAFLRPAAGVDQQTFTERWSAHVALVMRSEELARLIIKYAHNHAVGLDAAGEAESGVKERIGIGLSDVIGVSELGFATRADMVAYLRHPAREGIRADLEQFVDLARTVIVATNEVTMYERRQPVAEL